MFKALVSLALILTASLTATAQDSTREAFPFRRELAPITSIELVDTDNALELVITGDLPDGCVAAPTVVSEVVGTTLFVDIYRDIQTGMECASVLTPYEARIDARALHERVNGTEDAPTINVIVINGILRGVDYPTDGAEAPPMLNELLVRGPLPFDRVTTRHTPEGVTEITLNGTLSDACPIPVYRAYEDYQNPGFVVVEAYTAINIAAMCMQALTEFEAVMSAPLFETFAINGISVPFDPAISADVQAFVVQPMGIESVVAEWVEGILPNIKVTVNGITDGCEDPIQLVQQPTVDSTYTVSVVRVIRDQQPCTMIAREYTDDIYISPAPEHVDALQLMVNGEPVEITSAE